MKRRFRLTRETDFQRVRRFGKSYAHPLIVLVAFPNQLDYSRVGVAAGRTVGKAVRRNRAKRLLRATIQPLLGEIITGWDILLVARVHMSTASFTQTLEAVLTLLRRARLIREPYES